MNDIQPKRDKSIALPEAVYKQVTWMLRDMIRMKEKLRSMEDGIYSFGSLDMSTAVVSDGGMKLSDITAKKAVRIADMCEKIKVVESAFDMLPEKYRKGIYDKLVLGVPYPDTYHANTWKKWQQILVYKIANDLNML